MTNYISRAQSAPTPQSESARDDQVKNNAGGYVFALDKWQVLRRFLILGSEGGSYYVSERNLTLSNVKVVDACLAEDGKRVVDMLLEVSEGGLAHKQEPTMFALAKAIAADDVEVRRAASEAVHRICRTASHMQMFMAFARASGRGWGRIMRRTVRRWFSEKADAYQLVKYQQRNGWSNRDILRMAHVKPETDEQRHNWAWVTGHVRQDDGAYVTWVNGANGVNVQIAAHEELKHGDLKPKDAARLIRETRLPREAVPTEYLQHKEVWEALLDDMPMTALIRNLATLTRIGLVAPLSSGTKLVLDQLGDAERLRRARVHPIALLAALTTYQSGASVRGSATWTPVPSVVSALDAAFYTSFDFVEPTGKRFLLGLDVSGSMWGGSVSGVPGLTPGVAATAMSMLTARTEQQSHILGFDHGLTDLRIAATDSLTDAMAKVKKYSNGGGTDCSLPMAWARESRVPVDVFAVYTDNETWAGRQHPYEALKQYRTAMGIDAKEVVVGMLANSFTIADPADPGMLDVVGFDPSVPTVMSSFAQGLL